MSFLYIRFSGRYKAESLLTKTKLKNVYRGRNIQTGELVVIKAEFFKSKSSNILFEGKFLQMTQGSPGIPWMHWCGPESDECNCLIVEHLGYSIEDLFQLCHRRFSLKTVTMLGIQLLEMVEVYHFKELIHRNICPHGLQLGKGKKNNRLYFNDLLSSKKYIDTKTSEHIPKREALVPEISNPFNSMNVLKGYEPSRRDDLESMLLVLLYWLKGDLPWLSISEDNPIERGTRILSIRKNLSKAELFRGVPREFQDMWDHVTELRYEEKPNYLLLSKKLKRVQSRNQIDNDYAFDWLFNGIADNEKLECANVYESPVNCEVIPNEDTFLKLFYEPYEKDLYLNEIEKKIRSKRAIELEESSIANQSQHIEYRTSTERQRTNRSDGHTKYQCSVF